MASGDAQIAYVGLGSNLENPGLQIQLALDLLSQHKDIRLQKISSQYETLPMGPTEQPNYRNAVVEIETDLDPFALLNALQQIETEQGRVRGEQRWRSRTLDLDLLLYGHEILISEDLVIPHPGLHERSFVLYPLLEIAPEIELPGLGLAKNYQARVDSLGIKRVLP